MKSSQWLPHIEQQSKSGKTVKEYCRGYGLSHKSFSFYKSQLKSQQLQSQFVEIGAARKEVPVCISFSNGMTMTVDGQHLKEILPMLLGCEK